MPVTVIVQARMSSTRLPGKVMADLCGHPLLEHLIRRINASSRVHSICIATTRNESDDVLVELAERLRIHSYRGSEDDVLSRYLEAARMLQADPVVRVTSDCPLYDFTLLDEMLAARERAINETGPIDCYSNCLHRTYPRGLDTEIMSMDALKRLEKEATDPRAREHVTWHIYRNPNDYRLVNHARENDTDHSELRWTVDTPEDLEFVRQVYALLYPDNPLFDRHDVLALLERKPELLSINRHVRQKEQ